MQAQGSALINTAYFDNLITKIDHIGDAAQLQKAADDAMASIQPYKSAVEAKIQTLAPYLALISAPSADLTKIVTWITDFITASIAPQVTAYEHYVAQAVQIPIQVGRVASAIQTAEQRLAANISIPTLV